jgi:hypothetical protein
MSDLVSEGADEWTGETVTLSVQATSATSATAPAAAVAELRWSRATVRNRFMFDAAPFATARTGAELEALFTVVPPFSTIAIEGELAFDSEMERLNITQNVRLLGVGGSARIAGHVTLLVWGMGATGTVVLEDLALGESAEDAWIRAASAIGSEGGCGCCDHGHEDVEVPARPTLEATDCDGIIAYHCSVEGGSGTAIMLDEGARAYLAHCTIFSENFLGVVAMTASTLSMYDCTVQRCMWGAYAGGTDGRKLLSSNTFRRNDEDVTGMYDDMYSGQIVQPWQQWRQRMPK